LADGLSLYGSGAVMRIYTVLTRALQACGMKIWIAALTLMATPLLAQTTASTEAMPNPYTQLMTKVAAHTKMYGAKAPLLSPVDSSVVRVKATPADAPLVPVSELQAMGVRVVPWTTNDPEQMRAVIRTGVDGLISDRPDLLQKVVAEELAARPSDVKLQKFVVSAHRGGRGLRPENTLPSFESGLDQLAKELETDTGVSTDGVSLIWHDQFYNPQSCRKADGSAYTMENRVYLRDISSVDAQKTFICDKLHFGDAQKNDLALSPVAVAFAKREGMISPYAPTYVAQLFRFVNFYVEYYSKGAGKSDPHAAERAANARAVHFNIETKILPDAAAKLAAVKYPNQPKELFENHTKSPQAFVDALGGIIVKERMEGRAAIQSFDFRTLQLVEEQHPKIQTFYLTEGADSLFTEYVPAGLRVSK
jgi:glycerophosphoryl diester phosphodiesterase